MNLLEFNKSYNLLRQKYEVNNKNCSIYTDIVMNFGLNKLKLKKSVIRHYLRQNFKKIREYPQLYLKKRIQEQKKRTVKHITL